MNTTYPRRFVPQNLDVADFSQLEPLYNQLIDRPIHSANELEQWLGDVSELSSVVDEYGSRRYIDKSCHTEDPQIERAYMHFVEQIDPKIKPLFFQLQRKLLDSPFLPQLQGQRYRLLERKWRSDVELFREENIPLETQITKLVTDYDKISGAMMVQFRGGEYTLQQLARFIEEPDRQVRQEAWETSANRRLQDRERIDELFDKLLPLRQQIATNSAMDNYRSYVWKAYKRFDYTPEDCLRFADAIEKACVPVVDELDRQRAADLKLERLRPWDLSVDPKNRPPLRPFADDQTAEFVQKVKTIFSRLSGQLAEDFDVLRQRNNLDLQSRKGKQPGGYQCSLDEAREPFIFMNAAGLQRDVETLLHEGGHAFHCLAAREEPLVFLRSAPMEFCEVASISMELLGSEHFDVFYADVDANRARRAMLEGIIRFFPWMATIDVFQHWIYTHPGHTGRQRTEQWLAILDRFSSKVDWSGYEAMRQSQWQRQLHLFHAPFYYVEYGIAQLGALQLWIKSKEDPRRAVSNYRAALRLGGTKTLPELFAVAGIRFDFSERTLGPLMGALRDELSALPR
ncbi:MAG: M3 family oligoendopeptidase [Phycisphaerales bacterium]|nr:M3 family oligoendopeptidase [Phycisphaerales bacterium]